MKNDPLAPIEILTRNETTANPNVVHQVCLNQCFSGGLGPVGNFTYAQYQTILDTFRAASEQYRLTALSVTGVFIGATITDQGSVVSAQMSDGHQDAVMQWGAPIPSNGAEILIHNICQDVPEPDTLIMGTQPYVAKAKDGFYVPYKIGSELKWLCTDNLKQVVRSHGPFIGQIEWLHRAHTNIPYGNTLADNETPGTWLAPGDDNLSVTWVTGIARSTSFRLTYRIAIEVMTRPDSVLAPFTELPALPDEHAIHMYYEISSRMKDAYPASDNDRGTLWNKVKDIARGLWDVVSPGLASAFPVLGPAAVTAVNTALPLVKGVARALGRRGRNIASRPGRKQVTNPLLKADKQYSDAVSEMQRIMSQPRRGQRTPAGNQIASISERASVAPNQRRTRTRRRRNQGGSAQS